MALRKMLDSCGRTALVVAGSLNTWTEDIRENTRIFTCSFVERPINKYMILKTLKCLWLTISHFRPSTSGTWVQLNPQAEKRNRNGSHSKAAAIAWEMVPSENISEFLYDSPWFLSNPYYWSIEICKLPSIDWLQLGLYMWYPNPSGSSWSFHLKLRHLGTSTPNGDIIFPEYYI